MDSRLFEFTMKLLCDDNPPAPARQRGAYVTCYAAASEPLEAVRKGVSAVREKQYTLIDLMGDVREVRPETWDDYLRRVWPRHQNDFPDVAQIDDLIARRALFFGPFSEFELTAANPVVPKHGLDLD